jgi:hypothetical protein
MGTSYQTFLVAADLARVGPALVAVGVDGLMMPAGKDRTAVMPREGDYDVADSPRMAARVSGRSGFATLSNELVDSDVLFLRAFRDGRATHEYVSDQAMLVDWFIDGDGSTKFRLNGIEYSADAPYPTGPAGADPAVLAPFGVGRVDQRRLGAALRGEFGTGTRVPAEAQHRAILDTLNLDPRGLMTAFRFADPEDLPGSVRIGGRQVETG